MRALNLEIFTQSVAYKPEAKRQFHRQADAVLRALAKELGYQKGDYDLRHNQGGVAVSGEITLHSNKLYVQISQSVFGPREGFMWRTCRGREDFSGGLNRRASWDKLTDLHALSLEMLRVIDEGSPDDKT